MPIKFTWKSILGCIALLGGPTVALSCHAMPSGVATALAAGGAFIIGLERIADSRDLATMAGPGAAAELAKVRADATAEIASAKAEAAKIVADGAAELTKAQDEIAHLTPLANAAREALAAMTPAAGGPPAPPIAAAPLT
jgi:hypothetical protein